MAHPDPETAPRHRAPVSARHFALLLWAAFLTACFGTMVFFAIFDPVLLAHDDAPPGWLADRMTGYACGFFFFWMLCSVAAFVTVCMIDPRAPRDER